MSFAGAAVMALLIEAVINALKPAWNAEVREDRNLVTFYAALGVGVALTVLGGVSIFEPAGVPLDTFPVLSPWVGFVFTGIILSRGANAVAGLIKAVRDVLGSDEIEFEVE